MTGHHRGSGGRQRPLVLQPVLNRIVQVLLRTPVLSRVVGRGLITLYVVGRRTGRRYTARVPGSSC